MNMVGNVKAATGLDLQRLLERFGAPTLIAVLVLTNLSPKIDRGIAIADHVDAELQYLAAVGCAPAPRAVVPPSASLSGTPESPQPPTPIQR